jgi:RNA-directed DNA polymerase
LDTIAVNGPEDVLDEDTLDWRTHEDNVAKQRRRIFTATREHDAELSSPATSTGLA